jgi:hypothetical protein
MPVKQGARLVELRPEIVKKFEQYKEDKDSRAQFTTLINDILDYVWKKEQFLKGYLPHLDAIAVKDKSVYIQNLENRQVFEVTVDEKVKCMQDGDDQCEHARYAIAMIEFGKIVRLRSNLEYVTRLNGESQQESKNKTTS